MSERHPRREFVTRFHKPHQGWSMTAPNGGGGRFAGSCNDRLQHSLGALQSVRSARRRLHRLAAQAARDRSGWFPDPARPGGPNETDEIAMHLARGHSGRACEIREPRRAGRVREALYDQARDLDRIHPGPA